MTTSQSQQLHPLYQELSYTQGVLPGRDNRCVICYDDMNGNEQVLTHTNARCNRSFHPQCIESVIERQQRDLQPVQCPVCREQLSLRPWDELPPRAKLQQHAENEFNRTSDTMMVFLNQRGGRALDDFDARLQVELHRLQGRLQDQWETTTDFAAARQDFNQQLDLISRRLMNAIIEQEADIDTWLATLDLILKFRIVRGMPGGRPYFAFSCSPSLFHVRMIYVLVIHFAIIFGHLLLLKWTGFLNFGIEINLRVEMGEWLRNNPYICVATYVTFLCISVYETFTHTGGIWGAMRDWVWAPLARLWAYLARFVNLGHGGDRWWLQWFDDVDDDDDDDGGDGGDDDDDGNDHNVDDADIGIE